MRVRGVMAGNNTAMADQFLSLNDLASCRNGGRIIFATDDFFAVAENLIKAEEPIWQEGVYTALGKWMDGWETRRRRKPGHDFCILQLGALTVIRGVNLNTAFFTGNHAPTVSIQVSSDLTEAVKGYPRMSEIGSEAREEAVEKFDNATKDWATILNCSLKPGIQETRNNLFPINDSGCWKYLRLNLYPDGGVARLRVFGHVVPPRKFDRITDLVSIANGGECISYSNAHFGHPQNLLCSLKSLSMADGWETARRLDRTPILAELSDGQLNYNGNEWCIFKLGVAGRITCVIVQTYHFIGNYPDRIQIEASDGEIKQNSSWIVVQPFEKLAPNTERRFDVNCDTIFKYIRLTIKPDGGISRLRVMGEPYDQK